MKRVIGAVAALTCLFTGDVVSQSSLRSRIEEAGSAEQFRVLNPGVIDLRVGSLVIPGAEAAGAVPASRIESVTRELRTTEKRIAWGTPVRLATVSELVPGMPAPDSACGTLPLEATGLRITSLVIPERESGAADLYSRLAKELRVEPEALQNYVMVTGVVTVTARVPGCKDVASTERLVAHVGRVAVGYQAGRPSSAPGAFGRRFIVSVLQMFELDAEPATRTVLFKDVDTVPPNLRIGWIDQVRAYGRSPNAIPDDDFTWMGVAPLQATRLPLGRVYVRLIRGATAQTQPLDITPDRNGASLHLRMVE